MDPVARWTEQLQAWALPQALLDAAPANPYAFPAAVIRHPTVDPRATPTGEAVLERLAPGERLLDVGCGAGRICGAFTADHDVVGVEPRAGLAEVAREVGVTVHEGRWPDLAGTVGTAPVVLSTHVLHDVQTPTGFLQAMHAAATRRVVLEISTTHPWSDITPLYRHLHDLDRPAGPTVEDLVEVVRAVLDVHPEVVRWRRPRASYDGPEDLVVHLRQRLCVGPEADRAIQDLVADDLLVGEDGRVRMPDQDLATLWWESDGATGDAGMGGDG